MVVVSQSSSKTRTYDINHFRFKTSDWVSKQIYKCNYDNLTPRLYNCVNSRKSFVDIKSYFKTYVGGPYPDISYLVRLSFMTSIHILITDIPAIAVNAKHAKLTLTAHDTDKNNSSGKDKFHVMSLPSFYGINGELLSASNSAHLFEYIGEDIAHLFVNSYSLMRCLLSEISFPMRQDLYHRRKRYY